jgi:hypothetical protein
VRGFWIKPGKTKWSRRHDLRGGIEAIGRELRDVDPRLRIAIRPDLAGISDLQDSLVAHANFYFS